MKIGVIILVIGVVAYFVNIILMRHFINKRMPDFFDPHKKLPDGNYAWENTAKTGTVPKWVSLIGLLGFGFLITGLIIIVISFFR